MELHTVGCEVPQVNESYWSNEVYPGEFDDLSICNLYSKETRKPVPPRLVEGKYDLPSMQFKGQPNQDILQVFISLSIAIYKCIPH